jgi:hypothetical protein
MQINWLIKIHFPAEELPCVLDLITDNDILGILLSSRLNKAMWEKQLSVLKGSSNFLTANNFNRNRSLQINIISENSFSTVSQNHVKSKMKPKVKPVLLKIYYTYI